MIRLLKIEWRKVATYKPFWVLLGLYIALLTSVIFGADEFLRSKTMQASNGMLNLTSIYLYPDSWHFIGWIATWFSFLLAILIITLTTNEIGYKTVRQQFIDGLSRGHYIAGKVLLFLIIALVVTALTTSYVLILSQNTNPDNSIWNKANFMIGLFIETFGYLSLALLLSLIVKRTGVAILLFIFYPLIEGLFLGNALPGFMNTYLPYESIDNVVTQPFTSMIGQEVQQGIAVTDASRAMLYSFAYIGISYFLLAKRDQ